MKFRLAGGSLIADMNGQCVMPQADMTLALQKDCSGGKFSYDSASGELAFGSGQDKHCVSSAVRCGAPRLRRPRQHQRFSQLCFPPRPGQPAASPEIWHKPMPNGGAAVVLFNRPLGPAVDMKIAFADLPGLNGRPWQGWPSSIRSARPSDSARRSLLTVFPLLRPGKTKGCTVRNIWQQTTSTEDDSVTVKNIPAHAGAFLRISGCK